MKITDITGEESVSADLTSNGKMDVLGELGQLLANRIPGADPEAITKTLVERERLATTGVGGGIAIPHGKLDGATSVVVAIGISKTGIDFGAIDSAPVHIFFALVAPMDSSGDHLRALARISRMLKDPDVRERFRSVRDNGQLIELLREEDGKS